MTGKHAAILGISAFYHDSAAALVVDGEIIAAAQEERFSRIRHDASFPSAAVAYCLREAQLTPEQLDYLVFYDKPLKKFDRILETYLAYAPRGFASFQAALPVWLKQKLHVPREIQKCLDHRFKGALVFTDHHQSHAASAFFASPYDRAAVLCMDGVGEWATTSWGVGERNRIELRQALSFPHSLGLLYSAFTYFTGFKVNSGEYKLMGLAPYGQPKYVKLIKDKLIDIKPDGSYRLAMEYFDYASGLTMTGKKFAALFGGPPRSAEAAITERELDMAASIQAVTEEVILLTARHVHAQTRAKYLCLGGGVALNCVANGRLLRETPYEDIWIQPAAGDAGGALGAALFAWHQLLENPRTATGTDRQKGSLLGPAYGLEETRSLLEARGARFRHVPVESELLDFVVERLAEGHVVGWSQGRAEFGPRALGNRSILGDARNPGLQATLNLKIKHRESFRPFAASVLAERAHEIFELGEHVESPYMLLVAQLRTEHRLQLSEQQQRELTGPDLRQRINVVRSRYPAITHVDYSARIQTVDAARHGRYYRLMKAFEAKTGCPVLVNTSFNVRGEPIVDSPEQAYNCFMHTDMDVLVVGDLVLLKAEQPQTERSQQRQYLSQFALD